MSRIIELTSTQLKNKKEALEGNNEKFKGYIDELQGYVDKLTSMWEGQASDSFKKKFANDKGSMETLYSEINNFIGAIDFAISSYEEAEKQNVGLYE
ncbi:MAG: WXG100 family type VII secretion target [Agathobacter sp.]|nr:WXG100 family type VII secretion target [Agathobacter sp.]